MFTKQVGVTNRLEPEQNIRGGGKYLSKLIKRIPDRIPQPDRTWLALAAYNVGWGHVNDARIITEQQGASPDKWADVKKRLPLLIKKRYYRKTRYGYSRGDVAVKYVDNIRRYYDALVWLDENDAIDPEPEADPVNVIEPVIDPVLKPINEESNETESTTEPESVKDSPEKLEEVVDKKAVEQSKELQTNNR